MDLYEVRKRYENAVDSFIDKIRDDPNVIAVIVCGSLSYDTVWEKSDVDMTAIVRDQKLLNREYCIIEDGIILNVSLIQRSDFRRGMEKLLGGSWSHSYFSKGRIIYSTDESLYEYFDEIKQPGKRDLELSMLMSACNLVCSLQKCEKWLTVKSDLLYCQRTIAMAATDLANIEILLHGEIPTRESIQRAKQLNPELMKYFYDDILSAHWSSEHLYEAIKRLDGYLEKHISDFTGPVIEFLLDGEIKTISQITEYFKVPSHWIVEIFDYLSEKGLIEKVSKTIRITPKSRMAVEEAAYQLIRDIS